MIETPLIKYKMNTFIDLFNQMAIYNGLFLTYNTLSRKSKMLSQFKLFQSIGNKYKYTTLYIDNRQEIQVLFSHKPLQFELTKTNPEVYVFIIPKEKFATFVDCLNTPSQTLIHAYFEQTEVFYYELLNLLPSH